MNADPIIAFSSDSQLEIYSRVELQLRNRAKSSKSHTRYIPIVDEQHRVIDVFDLFAYKRTKSSPRQRVSVYGLGYVGLTLSVLLASRGYSVLGIDNNVNLVEQLRTGHPHVLEPYLPEMMREALRAESLSLSTSCDSRGADVHIVAVGTPINPDGTVSLTVLEEVVTSISRSLKFGNIVMLRSTVPVGTSRDFVVPILENESKLKCGRDFYLAFAPERTIEGNALNELSTLPQIIGGYSPICAEMAAAFWKELTRPVHVSSIEAAELVKLLNNSFRDLSFAFANGFAMLASSFNLDAAQLISAANDGYPRNTIPLPSPGVGGYCLTKDPLLYASFRPDDLYAQLSTLGRQVNEHAANYPLAVLKAYAKRNCKSIHDMSVLILGISFKGQPITNDIRGSTSLAVGQVLLDKGSTVYSFDSTIQADVIRSHGFRYLDTISNEYTLDAILILNNNPLNLIPGLREYFARENVLVFDPWKLIDRLEVEKSSSTTYACMGYMTPL